MIDQESRGKPIKVLLAQPKEGDDLTAQALRYPISSWSEAEAKNHCESSDGIKFEPATGSNKINLL